MTTLKQNGLTFEEIKKAFEQQGINKPFEGNYLAKCSFSIGEEIDENGEKAIFMINPKGNKVYQFHDLNHALRVYKLIICGI